MSRGIDCDDTSIRHQLNAMLRPERRGPQLQLLECLFAEQVCL
jgi:hypothetical protein